MLKNYILIAVRTMRRQRVYSFINVSGLAVGLACFLLILLFVRDELSYDRFHENADRIYRVVARMGSFGEHASVPALTAPRLVENFPEVIDAVRFHKSKETLNYGREWFVEERFFYADSSVFQVFSFNFLEGDPRSALSEPNNVVLTESAARRYYGDANPMNRTLLLQDGKELRITGIVEDVPHNAHFRFDFLASFSTLGELGAWGSNLSYTYLILPDRNAAPELGRKLSAITAGANELSDLSAVFGWAVAGMQFRLQPITDIHLYSNLSGEAEQNSDVRYVYIFSVIGLFILLMACINYVNLATARSAIRTREVGVRMALGAGRAQLARQFLCESTILGLLSLPFAGSIVYILLPYFNVLTGKSIDAAYVAQPDILLSFVATGLLVGLISGAYPAIFLSRLKPALVLKVAEPGMARARLRNGLVVFQFAVSVSLISVTVIIHRQLEHLRTKPLGYNTEHIMTIPTHDSRAGQQATFKQELQRLPGVSRVSVSSGTPLNWAKSFAEIEGESVPIHYLSVDHDYLTTLGIDVIAGRDFSPSMETDSSAIVINETAARLFGLENQLGDDVGAPLAKGELIGIVSDFHVSSLHEPIAPTVLHINPPFYRYFVIRFHAGSLAALVVSLESLWQQFAPNEPFSYSILDDVMKNHYEAEQRLAGVSRAFSFLAILIACAGIFGLASYAAVQRSHEIGIRKVLGATAVRIFAMLSHDFVKLIVPAVLISAPVAYFIMQRWLESFAYRIEIELGTFALTGALVILIALGTVSFQAIKVALVNPVDALRNE